MTDPSSPVGGSLERAYELPTVERLIAALSGGDGNFDATKDYQAVISAISEAVENHGGTAKGTLTLKFQFTADAKGVDVVLDSSARLPTRPKVKDRLFVSGKGTTLTAMDPARDTLFAGSDLGRMPRTRI
ncbi:MAG: hypothetical protein ABT940_03065 [Alphaproteobacteria bacterium]